MQLAVDVKYSDNEARGGKGGPGSGFHGHEGRPGQVGGSGNAVHVPDDPSGYGDRYYGSEHRGFGPLLVRGTPISPNDPRIPDTVYHVSPAYDAIKKDGFIRAGGMGGLGGDNNDRIVSMTTDRNIALGLQRDMGTVARLAHEVGPVPELKTGDLHAPGTSFYDTDGARTEWGTRYTDALKEQAKREGWDYRGPQADIQLKTYGPSDWLADYFNNRDTIRRDPESPIHGDKTLRNPYFMSYNHENWMKMDPEKIGIFEIPKATLKTGAMLTDLDLDNPSGLSEVRSYGDIPITKTKMWSFSMLKGGPGSGDHGHSGRPGEVGGSSSEPDDFAAAYERGVIDGSPEKLYHVAPTSARTAIQQYGLRGGGLSSNPRSWEFMFEPDGIGDTQSIDVWKVDARGVRIEPDDNEAADPNEDFVLKERVPPEKLRLMHTLHYNGTPGGWFPEQTKKTFTPRIVEFSLLEREAPSEGKGGPGSGDHGHAGRPGEVGGSAPDSGTWHRATASEGRRQERALAKLKLGATSALKDIAAATGGELSQADVREFKSLWLDGHLGDPQYVAMQFAAAKLFGTSIPKYVQQNKTDLLNAMPRVGRMWQRYVDRAQVFLKAQYEVTQTRLKGAGVSDLHLYRGMKVPEATGIRLSRVESSLLKMNPLSSWTDSWEVAKAFADGEYQTSGMRFGKGVRLISRVPASRILSLASTGMGSARQQEAILTGGPLTVASW